MKRPVADKLQLLLSRGSRDAVLATIQNMDPPVAADVFMSLPMDEQQNLFRLLPIDFAAKLASIFPYYHTFVLLHSRPLEELRAIVDRMQPGERLHFFDELPEPSWQQLMDEIAESGAAAPATAEPVEAAPAPRSEPIIEAHQIERSFPRPDGSRIQVIAPMDLTVESEMIVALLGPSGSGKSTLLRMLTGLSAPTAGEVSWHGKPIAVAQPNIAIVFQSFALFPWLTVIDNVEVPLIARGMEPDERRRQALRAVDSVGLHGFENAYPKELSGGMKQRVGFARALVVEPEILFMDEPFSALDVLTAENLRGELLELWLGRKIPTKTIFIVTHNIEEAVMLADRVIVLGRNPGRIRADFRTSIRHPRDRGSAEFLVYVDYIYKMLTQPQLEAKPPTGSEFAPRRYQMLPHAKRGAIAGLLELLNDRGGKEDLYRIAEELRMEVDDLLPIVEAAHLLSFARSDRGDVEITPRGKAFAEADILERRELFREAALENVTLLQQMSSALASKSDHEMPLEFFRDLLEQHFSDEEAQRQIDTALNWGRYADILTYDSHRDRLLVPGPDTDAAEGQPTDH
jgi:NitT/TauT family transport system ATP-binding protein